MGAPYAAADHADAAARAVAWLLLQYGRRGEERCPAPLRLWWAFFLLLSVLAVAVHAVTVLRYRLAVPALSWARDAVSVLAGAVLLVAGWFSADRRGDSASEEPLLETAAESDTVDASIFTGAGFLSILTFSWMGTLLAVGHSKTLDLDDKWRRRRERGDGGRRGLERKRRLVVVGAWGWNERQRCSGLVPGVPELPNLATKWSRRRGPY